MVFDVQTSDEGYYFCVIENDLGRMTSMHGQLSVWGQDTHSRAASVQRTLCCENSLVLELRQMWTVKLGLK